MVLAQLRAATRPAHERLDGALGLLGGQLDCAAYTRLVERFYGFWRGWEPHVAAQLHDEAFLAPRRRLHLLAADLAALGRSPHAIEQLPSCPVPLVRDAAEALGSLYVMEGSTLGGRVIQRNVERCLGPAACSYFAGYGPDTGAMWRSFLARLDDAPAAQASQVARGATATFERVGWWLTRT